MQSIATQCLIGCEINSQSLRHLGFKLIICTLCMHVAMSTQAIHTGKSIPEYSSSSILGNHLQALDLLLPKLEVILKWLLHELRRAQRLLQNDYNVDSMNHDIILNNSYINESQCFVPEETSEAIEVGLLTIANKLMDTIHASPDCTLLVDCTAWVIV